MKRQEAFARTVNDIRNGDIIKSTFFLRMVWKLPFKWRERIGYYGQRFTYKICEPEMIALLALNEP